jgi:hypothetical protein
MKLKRQFYVKWQDRTDPAFDPEQSVYVSVAMPQEIADIERPVIEGIKNLIEEYNKKWGLDDEQKG